MRIVIVGAGKVGTFIAVDLVANGHDVVVVERDAPSGRAAPCRRPVSERSSWVVADACEISDLARAEPDRADVLLAVTGDDEDNLVASLLAKQEFGVPV